MEPQHRPFILEMPVLDREAFNAVHILPLRAVHAARSTRSTAVSLHDPP